MISCVNRGPRPLYFLPGRGLGGKMIKKILIKILTWALDKVDVSVTYDSGKVYLVIEYDEKIVFSRTFNVKK